MNRRLAVYTAIFGGKDHLQPATPRKNCDLIVFTDDAALASPHYRVTVCPTPYEDPTMNAKIYKILAHQALPEYEYSLWIDANIRLEHPDPGLLFDSALRDHEIAMHGHPERTCIYEEAEVCIQIGKDSPAVIREQIAKYRNEGYPAHNGLRASGIIYRKHTRATEALNSLWWREIARHSRRDQLSFNYASWKLGIDCNTLDGFPGNGDVEGFSMGPHAKPQDYRYW